jgi:hypothetical protein
MKSMIKAFSKNSFTLLATAVFAIGGFFANTPQAFAHSDQTITFGNLSPKTYGDSDFDVSATATSGLTVSFSVSPSGVCTMADSNTVHIVGAGDCTITASQAGNNQYNSASKTLKLNIAKKGINYNR